MGGCTGGHAPLGGWRWGASASAPPHPPLFLPVRARIAPRETGRIGGASRAGAPRGADPLARVRAPRASPARAAAGVRQAQMRGAKLPAGRRGPDVTSPHGSRPAGKVENPDANGLPRPRMDSGPRARARSGLGGAEERWPRAEDAETERRCREATRAAGISVASTGGPSVSSVASDDEEASARARTEWSFLASCFSHLSTQIEGTLYDCRIEGQETTDR